MLNPNLPHLNGHGVAEPPASASHELLESALDVLVDHTFATSLTCLIFLCVALELVRYWRAEEEKQRKREAGSILPQRKKSTSLKKSRSDRSIDRRPSQEPPPPPRKHSMGDRDSSRRMSGSDGMGDKRGSDPLSALGRSLKNVLNKDRRKSQ